MKYDAIKFYHDVTDGFFSRGYVLFLDSAFAPSLIWGELPLVYKNQKLIQRETFLR